MADEKFLLLDAKVPTLGVDSVKEFALYLKLDDEIGEGKPRFSMIKAIRAEIEKNLENFTQLGEKIEYLNGLFAFLENLPPVVESHVTLDKQKELAEIEKQKEALQLKERQLRAQILDGEPSVAKTDNDVIEIPMVGIDKSILHRDFKIQGQVPPLTRTS